MIHKNISIKAEGSLKDSHLTTYILDSYEELEPNLKRPLVLICPGVLIGLQQTEKQK